MKRQLWILITIATASTANSQTEDYIPPYEAQIVHYCYPPEDPILDQGLLDQIGISLTGEFSRYFNEANAYLICLDRSKSDTMERVNGFADIYREILNRE